MNEFFDKLINLMNEYNVRLGRHTEFVDVDTQMPVAMIGYDDFDKPFYNFKHVENDAVQCRKFYL